MSDGMFPLSGWGGRRRYMHNYVSVDRISGKYAFRYLAFKYIALHHTLVPIV